ncbi:hypothetical protein B7494_g4600 [Chlorociboria aeruginascens]|nr:hypothetical protein B7494_g4600 [Chlorociboria aeruginascens]
MSPIAMGGPLHSNTSVKAAGPVSMSSGTNGPKIYGLDGIKSVNRIFPHINDIISAKPDVDINAPIRRVLQTGEMLAKQADTHLDFHRPDLALKAYTQASIVAVEMIPRHKDYPSLQSDKGEAHRLYLGLRKRINVQHEKFTEVKGLILENNARSGIESPLHDQSILGLGSLQNNGHDAAQSVKEVSITDGVEPNTFVKNASSARIGSPNISTPRKKPPVQPKPEALHGTAIQIPSITRLDPSPIDLNARFARLRNNESPVQDPRVRTQPIPSSIELSTRQPGLSQPYIRPAQTASINRPSGPREMPTAPINAPRSVNTDFSVDFPLMPRPPDAIYSPPRPAEISTSPEHPPSISRTSSFSGHARKASLNTLNRRTPLNTMDERPDYFTPAHSLNGALFSPSQGPQQPIKPREELILSQGTNITAETLMKYLEMGNHTLRTLLVDVRSREEFDNGHIMSQAIICVEPIILRHGISAEQLGESIILSPDSEQKAFEQRGEVDLVVFYDQSSFTVPSGSSLHNFQEAIFKFSYEKRLKRHPVLLLGGLDAWVDLMGVGSLQSSSTSSNSIKAKDNLDRPLNRLPVQNSRISSLSAMPKYKVGTLSKEDEEKWNENIKNDEIAEYMDSTGPDDILYARTTEDFFRRYPELPIAQESMVSVGSSSQNPLETPRPPTRPAPALPRQRSSGVSDRTPNPRSSMIFSPAHSAPHNTIFIDDYNKRGFTGLTNCGNSCYASAAIQALCANPTFRTWFLRYKYPPDPSLPVKSGERSPHPQLMVRLIANLFGNLWSGKYTRVTPKSFWDYVRAVDTINRGGRTNEAFGTTNRQQDCHEFLTSFIFTILDDETNLCRLRNPRLTLNDEDLKRLLLNGMLLASHQEFETYTGGRDSIISRTFGFQHANITKCGHCGYQRQTWWYPTEFQLQVFSTPKKADKTIDILDMFRAEWNVADPAQDFQCEKCQKRNTSIWRYVTFFPDYLIITVNRIIYKNHMYVKDNTVVKFPERGLNLTEFFIHDDRTDPDTQPLVNGQSGPFIYDCYSVIQHIGPTFNAGHYIAFNHRFDQKDNLTGKWYQYNDTSVTEAAFSSTQTGDSYILFYVRRKNSMFR